LELQCKQYGNLNTNIQLDIGHQSLKCENMNRGDSYLGSRTDRKFSSEQISDIGTTHTLRLV